MSGAEFGELATKDGGDSIGAAIAETCGMVESEALKRAGRGVAGSVAVDLEDAA